MVMNDDDVPMKIVNRIYFISLIIMGLLFANEQAFSCDISATTMNFGNYASNQSNDLLGSSSVTVNCSLGTSYSIELDSGLHGEYPWRKMYDGTAFFLTYGLYQDAATQKIWGKAQNNDHVQGLGTGDNQVYTVYGKVLRLQNVGVGTYTDQITATIIW